MNPISYVKEAVPSWWMLISTWRPGNRIAVLSAVWSHHAKRSGYHPAAAGLGVAIRERRMRLIPAAVTRRIVGEKLDAAYQIAVAMNLTGCDRLLVTDGDFNLKLIEDIRRVTTAKIYAVFHQIPNVLERFIAEAPRLRVDGAICVARCQIPLVRAIAPPEKTWFVPHGVDTDYFSPSAPRASRPTVLCVGVHQRDFDTLRETADIVIKAVPTASVRLIAPQALLPAGLKLGAVELITDISDEQLLEEYRRAWVVLLPLKDSTANNAMLESMACGTPIVASDIGGVTDYAGPECGALCPRRDAGAHGAAVIDLLTDARRREAAGRAARARAERYSWPRVREQIRVILESDGAKTS